eukprot:m.25391 g.25391  ORF g.25391 m.25391 type:complete len:976 (-) comp7702_c0_seq1:57-2984(-)
MEITKENVERALQAWEMKQVFGDLPSVHVHLSLYGEEPVTDKVEQTADVPGCVESIVVAQLTALVDGELQIEGGSRSAFMYLCSVHRRAGMQLKMLRGGHKKDKVKENILENVLGKTAMYARLILQHPDLFPDPAITISDGLSSARFMMDCIRQDPRSEKGISDDMLTTVFQSFHTCAEDNEVTRKKLITEVFGKLLVLLHQDLTKEMSRLRPAIHVTPVVRLLGFPDIARMVLDLNSFLPSFQNGRQVTNLSFLGPIFSWTVCPQANMNPGQQYFPSVKLPMVSPDLSSSITFLRSTINSFHAQLHGIVKCLLRVKENRSKVLDFLEQAIVLNKNRTQDRHFIAERGTRAPEDMTLAPDGFMVNLGAVMIKLCEPFSLVAEPKFENIDAYYLLGRTDGNRARAIIEGPTLVPITDDMTSPTPKTPSNFTTECFFMTLACLNVGLIPTVKLYILTYFNPRSEYRRLVGLLEKLEKHPSQHVAHRIQLERVQKIVASMSRDMFCYLTQLHDQTLTASILHFYVFVCSWLLYLADPERQGYPLPKSVPVGFAHVPEYVVSDMAEFFSFVARLEPEHLEAMSPDKVATVARFYAVFIGNETYMKQKHLRTKLVEVLWNYTPEQRKGKSSPFFNVFLTDPIAEKYMAPSLVHFFVDIQDTDIYSRGYKRYQVAGILKNLWKSERHQAALVAESSSEKFLRYFMLLIDDSLDMMDEGRQALDKIVETKATIADPTFQSRPGPEQQEAHASLQRFEQEAKSNFEFGAEDLHAFAFYTTKITDPFLEPELASRLAAMINYNLKDIIRVTRPTAQYDDYGLNRSQTIRDIICVYVQVAKGKKDGEQSRFTQAVARDGRSFDCGAMKLAASLVRRMLPTDVYESFQEFISTVELLAKEEAEDDDDLGEIPDEYLDPIMAELMTDPVILPSSKQIMDRAVLRQHLLGDPIDPFNREPLSLDDVLPADDLRKEIEAWVAERRKQKK